MNCHPGKFLAALLLVAALVDAMPAVAQTPPVLVSAFSRKVHGSIGTFDLPLSLVPNDPTTESRAGPNATIVLTFDKPITSAIASISEGVATALAPAISGNNVIVGLAGAANAQYVTVSLANVTSADGGTGGIGTARIGFLLGDVNQSRVVTVSDLGLVNVQLAQLVTPGNFLKDVNASGTLTVSDLGITNANLTDALPSPLIANAIYVSPTGNDASPGTPLQPKRTVDGGVAAATFSGFNTVFVAVGNYGEAPVLTLRANVNVHGGYDPQTWLPAASGATTVQGGGLVASEGHYIAILAKNLAAPAALFDLTVVGSDATVGRGSFGIVALSSTLTLTRVTVVAGDGANGLAGASGANASPVGKTAGMDGTDGGDANEPAPTCDDTTRGSAGLAGTNALNPAQTNGGDGGAGGKMDMDCGFPFDFSATSGLTGLNAAVSTATFGKGGGGGAANSNTPGTNGLPGRLINGSGGTGGSGFQLVGNYPLIDAGGAGTTGFAGTGGGGGGGSGGNDSGADSYGAGGGGGGAGGIAAFAPGGGGAGGGPSIGIYALNSTLVVTNGTIQRGRGGDGGSGGFGGRGQDAGTGGQGGLPAGGSLAGGNGGAGAHGGHAGGGGGGGGGVSAGIVAHLSALAITGTNFTGGTPGAGGPGGVSAPGAPQQDGSNGAPGQSGTLNGILNF